jgi:hypothetical protein
MKLETRRAALRAAGALTGIAACSTPSPPAATREPDCVAITDQAFGPQDDYPGKPLPVASAVVQCCNAAMGDEGGAVAMRHRWACCANKTVEPQPAGLCTPWGPPVPPKMRRAA